MYKIFNSLTLSPKIVAELVGRDLAVEGLDVL